MLTMMYIILIAVIFTGCQVKAAELKDEKEISTAVYYLTSTGLIFLLAGTVIWALSQGDMP